MKTNNLFMFCLGAIVVLGFFALLYILSVIPIPADNKDSMQIVIGALVGAFVTIIGFFFGSSSGSQQKTEIMNRPPEKIKFKETDLVS
jgi:hypothetical protein